MLRSSERAWGTCHAGSARGDIADARVELVVALLCMLSARRRRRQSIASASSGPRTVRGRAISRTSSGCPGARRRGSLVQTLFRWQKLAGECSSRASS